MNIAPNFYNDALQGLDRITNQTNNDIIELTTGKRVNSISDDPLAAAEDYTLTLQTNANNTARPRTTPRTLSSRLLIPPLTPSSSFSTKPSLSERKAPTERSRLRKKVPSLLN